MIRDEYNRFQKIKIITETCSDGFKAHDMKRGLSAKLHERYGVSMRDEVRGIRVVDDSGQEEGFIVGELWKWALGMGYVEFIYDIKRDTMVSFQANAYGC